MDPKRRDLQDESAANQDLPQAAGDETMLDDADVDDDIDVSDDVDLDELDDDDLIDEDDDGEAVGA
jgi:hypothetical protein